MINDLPTSDFPTSDAVDELPAPANANDAPKKNALGNRNLSLRKRSSARMAAVQCLYQMHLNADMPFDALQLVRTYRDQWAHGVALGDKGMVDVEPDYKYLEKLLAGLRDARELLVPVRQRLLEKAWNAHRIAPLMEALFDVALFELHGGKMGTRLVLDEYMHIAARFFDENDIGFVNGVLHGAAEQLGKLPAAQAPAAE